MNTGLTPDFRPNAYKAALSEAATQAESTADTFTDDGGHPLHRQLVQLEDAWTATGGTRTLFISDADAVSHQIANALTNHAESVRLAANCEPSLVDPASSQGWKVGYQW